MSSVSLPQIGDVVAGKYKVERKLGEGGMGAVYAARNMGIDKVIALKVMLPETGSQEAVQRFINEAKNAAGLDSDHVVAVHDHGVDQGLHYMVLDLLDGKDLAQLGEDAVREGRLLEPHRCVGWVLQALKGIAVAHAKGIVHRDLKPSNLFLARKADGTEIIKVLDFGISKASQGALGAAPSALTSTKAMLGSPLYVAPEQVRSSKGVDQRADIWAVGVIMYELLTSAPPFMGEHLGELFAQIIEEKPIPITQRAPGVSPQLEAIVMKCLEKRPEARYQDVQTLMHDLQPFTQPMLMGTMAMNSPSPFAASFPGPAPMMAQTPSGSAHVPPGFLQTPAPMGGPPGGPPPGMGGVGAITGSGVHPPVVKPGSSTPQPGEWQSTTGGGTTMGGKKSAVFPILIGVSVALGVVGIGAIVVAKKVSNANATSATSAPPPPSAVSLPEPVVPPPASVSAATSAPPPPTAASAAPVAAPVLPSNVRTTTRVAPKPADPKPADPKPADPKPADPVVVKPPPPKPPTGPTGQGQSPVESR